MHLNIFLYPQFVFCWCALLHHSQTQKPLLSPIPNHISVKETAVFTVCSQYGMNTRDLLYSRNIIIKESSCMCHSNLHTSHYFDEDSFGEKKHRHTMGIFFMNMHLQTNTQFYIVPCYILCFCTLNTFLCYSKNR